MMNKEVIFLSEEIILRSMKEATYFPIDRKFLNAYVDRITAIKSVEFILFNIEIENPTYSTTLFLCLPELWEDLDMQDMEYLISQFSNPFSYYVISEFTHKYLGINILDMIVLKAKKMGFIEKLKLF